MIERTDQIMDLLGVLSPLIHTLEDFNNELIADSNNYYVKGFVKSAFLICNDIHNLNKSIFDNEFEYCVRKDAVFDKADLLHDTLMTGLTFSKFEEYKNYILHIRELSQDFIDYFKNECGMDKAPKEKVVSRQGHLFKE